jgi:hypothetical protein
VIGRIVAALIMAGSPALAAEDIIEVNRAADSTLFGSCVPSLIAANRSPAAVDYIQVDLEFSLRDGRVHRHAFKSSYRHGVKRPITSGASRPLVLHGDESQPMKASCADIVSIRVIDAICEADARPCPTTIAVKIGR